MTAIVGAIAIWFEMKRTKDMAEGEFVLTLNNSFSSNEDLKVLFGKLVNGAELTEEERPAIVEYLTFFETVYILITRNVVEIKIINDLFAYRFFMAVNNKYVQELELISDCQYYRNIYKLDRLWLEYRMKEGIECKESEYLLSKRAFEYGRLSDDKK
jgi:hypothetical protein